MSSPDLQTSQRSLDYPRSQITDTLFGIS